jgi:hypothetical protein
MQSNLPLDCSLMRSPLLKAFRCDFSGFLDFTLQIAHIGPRFSPQLLDVGSHINPQLLIVGSYEA